jgi:hypothetical protein
MDDWERKHKRAVERKRWRIKAGEINHVSEIRVSAPFHSAAESPTKRVFGQRT